MNRENRRHHVADRFREVATLIGDRQDKEIALASGQTVVPGLGMIEPAAALVERADRLENGGLRLAIVGSRSRGKSTLINALLGEDLLPMGMTPTTAVITQIVAGKREEVRLVEKSGEERTMSRKEFVEACVLDSENKVPQEFANVDYAVLESDTCRLCKAGLQLVDTLPFQANPENDAVTRAYLNQVDAVLLVLSGIQLFDNVDFDFINSVRRDGDSGLGHVFFLINDHGLDDEGKKKIFRHARGYLEPELGEAFERHVFLANAKSALEGRVAGQKDVVDATTLSAFEREIERFLKGSERVNAILDATVRDVLSPVIAAARSRMEDRKKLLIQSQEDMETTIRDFNAEFPQIQEKIASIQRSFDNFAKEIADTVADDVVSRVIALVGESSPQWKGLDIGGTTDDYMSDVEDDRRNAFAREITSNVARYFRENTYGTVLKSISSQLEAMSATLRAEVTDFVGTVGRTEAPWLMASFRKILSNCETGVNSIISSAVRFRTDEVSEFIKRDVQAHGGTRVVFGIMSYGLTELIRKESRSRGDNRRELVKRRYREELEKRFKAEAYAQEREIRDAIVEVFKDPSEKLQKNLIAEFERRKRILEDILETKRSGVAAETVRLRRLETINTCLDEAFDAICESAYGRVLTPQEQQEL